jgi:hypothetical protein
MMKSNRARWAIVLCFALLAAGCGDDDTPTAPTTTEPDPEPITLIGTWSGRVEGNVVTGDAMAMLTQDGANVTGDWSMQMPATLVALGAPAEAELAGSVTGTAMDMSAELSFSLDGFPQYFPEGCGIDVSVTSFDATTMEATWATNGSCVPPAVDMGTLTFMR